MQLGRIATYWAVLTIIFAILWAFLLNLLNLTGSLPALSLLIPILLGAVFSILLYFNRDHQMLEFDDAGYSIQKGKRHLETHRWPEFKECSLVKDGPRCKVRLYLERDGGHSDVDSSASGVEAYEFRDLAFSRISSSASGKEAAADVFRGLEREIHDGRAYWVADLNETFKDYQLSGEIFPLIARGGTRPKGFLLSRFVAFTVMPDYNVCMYTSRLESSTRDVRGKILRLIRIIETQRDQKNIKWSWLLLVGDDALPGQSTRLIEEFSAKDLGIGFVNLMTGNLIVSRNQLGRSLANQMHMGRLVRDLRRRKYI